MQLPAMVAGVIEQATDTVGRFGRAAQWKSTDVEGKIRLGDVKGPSLGWQRVGGSIRLHNRG